MALQLGTDGLPRILEMQGRRYVVCDEHMHRPDGTVMEFTRCGALVDVTDLPGIRVTDRCAGSHVGYTVPATEATLVYADGSPVS